MAHRSEPDGKKLIGNRNFWDSDFMTQHREGYYTSVRMHSTRTRNTDGASKLGGPINREGRVSHHVADGYTYILRRGDEYDGIAPVWNWQLVPGTTAQQIPALDQEHVAFRGGSSFVGGVSDGMYGAATMDLMRDGLQARKSWFYFDDEFVALGTGISDVSGNPVLTSVNQSLLNGAVLVSNQGTPLPQGDHPEDGARWVLHDETGYIFPLATPLHVANKTQSGRWSDIGTGPNDLVSKGVFTLYVDHGIKPENAAYEYIVVPNTNAQELDARLAHPTLQTLSNTPDLQAVWHNKLKILEAVFRRAGHVEGGEGWNIQVDQPCLLMVREKPGGVEITVANPENKPLVVNVGIDRKLTGEEATIEGTGTTIRVNLPNGLAAGSSVTRFFKQG